MAVFKVNRGGVTRAVQKVPTSTTLAALPMTFDRVDRDIPSDKERPVRIESVNDAMSKFTPQIRFSTVVGDTPFKVELDPAKLSDIDPGALFKWHQVKDEEGKTVAGKNDLAALQSNVAVQYQIKTLWDRPALRKAWADETKRKDILRAVALLRGAVENIKRGQ